MGEERLHFVLFESWGETVDLKKLSSNGEVVGNWIKLQSIDGFFHLKLLNNLIIPLINNVEPALFPAWNNIIPLTPQSVNVRFMNILNFMAKTTYSQIPNSNLPVLPSWNTQFVILKGYVLHFIMTLEHTYRFYQIWRQHRAQFSFYGRTLNVK